MGDEAEVGQAALDPGLHDGGRSGVSERRAVLGEQVCELFADLPEGREKFSVANRKAHVGGSSVPTLTLQPAACSCES